jgi:hypothetical protein
MWQEFPGKRERAHGYLPLRYTPDDLTDEEATRLRRILDARRG